MPPSPVGQAEGSWADQNVTLPGGIHRVGNAIDRRTVAGAADCNPESVTTPQIAFAHAAIDAGATLFIGHHPHVVQEQEEYRGGLIFYSLGNLVFDQYQREATQHGQIVEISFLGPHILASHIIPVKITPTGPEVE